jgi:murein DD-endopeptidase MepM/ murein hydrolase activator NlpD
MRIKNLLLLFSIPFLFVQGSCGTVVNTVFGPKTHREQYEQKIRETPEGRLWKAASEQALAQSVAVSLPYGQKGNFPDSLQVALGLQFNAKRGQKISFNIDKPDTSSFALFADLFYLDETGKPVLLHAADTSAQFFSVDVETAGAYVLRLQPEVLRGGSYSLDISSGPSVGFPVTDPKAYIGSFWGAVREGGKRNHEGVDIFARKGSPAIAALDGTVTGVHEGGIGGKVVWLRPNGKPYTLYYAHLDSQMVVPGQTVTKGDTVGLVGNTGNARTTPAHLHFGIYTFQGAVDPLPFVDKKIAKPAAVPAKSLTGLLKVTKAQKADSLDTGTLLTPLAVNAKTYLALHPNGAILTVPFNAVKWMPKTATLPALVHNPKSTTTTLK